jgi:hypothetical protein
MMRKHASNPPVKPADGPRGTRVVLFVAFIWDGKTMSLSNWMGGDIGHGVIHPKEKL